MGMACVKNRCCSTVIPVVISLFFMSWQECFAQSPSQMKFKVIVADEGNGKVHYIDLSNPSDRWSISTANRDLQLIGSDRLMVSVGDGYSEYNVKTGDFIKKVTTGGGVQSVFRLSDKSTFVGTDGNPASIKEVDSTGHQIRKINLAVNASLRIVRPTMTGTFLVGNNSAGFMYECDSLGAIKWQTEAGGSPYMALRLPNGNTLVSTGYGVQMVLVGKDRNIIKRFPTQADRNGSDFWDKAQPNFFAGFQILKNGNIVVSNWVGHGGGNGWKGYQLIEIDSSLTRVVSYWKQDASIVSSLHGVLVLDSLNTEYLNSDADGILAPVIPPVKACYNDKYSRFPSASLKRTAIQNECCNRIFGLDGRLTAGFSRYHTSGFYVSKNGIFNEVRN
ncbi:MAG: hypothetical protein GX556_18605 [Fibrobacter sp.]|nr:hypothetical protein [Fibrobacter sp.]